MKNKKYFFYLIAFAAIIVGLYAVFQGTGNERMAEKSNPPANSKITILKPFARGDMAAMRILDAPVDLNLISFDDDEGKKLLVSDWKGRVILLNLWATWCPPCRHEMPSLEKLELEFGSDKFEVVAVSIDLKSPDKPKAFFAEINLKALNFYWDGSAKIYNEFKKLNLSFGMPTTILIDENGMGLAVLNGPADWASDDAMALIAETLK